MTQTKLHFAFDNTYARQLSGFYTPWQGARVPEPKVVALNVAVAEELGLDAEALKSDEGARILTGSTAPAGADPLAQAYAGHQFGGFSPQLGDGRALLLGEVIDTHGRRRDIHLKGSGRTPFSRGGDGKAVLGPVLREYLLGEAMHGLHIPTTRALAAVTTGETVYRNGPKPGAVLARVASSHLRVGTFQYFAARGETVKVKQLADYAIKRHFPTLADVDNKYLAFLSAVMDVQAALIAGWLHVGFIHGVMNTDNTTISGETIDYGPCAFMDVYDPKAVFSSIDHNGRYAFSNQPVIARWNLARLAETLLPLIDPENADHAIELATSELDSFLERHNRVWLSGMRRKIGLATEQDDDSLLVEALFETMTGQNVDYTLLFRHLAAAAVGQTTQLTALFDEPSSIQRWLERWNDRLKSDSQTTSQRAAAMNAVNPLYIPRNHKVEETLEAAENDGDLAPFFRLLDVVSEPFTQRQGLGEYEMPAPADFGPYQTFCGT